MTPAEQLNLKALKQQAYAIKITTGHKQGHILTELARNHGYQTWAALLAAIKAHQR